KLEILADALGVSPGYLMGWEEKSEDIYTLAAHHDGDEWTEEELQSIEDFKNFIKNKRDNKK
ncbi:MAG: XRE family transcriptional regulator, partial [Sedimentibacter sp.]|nr:XRE family transcriptional regulator [Sedimentibacter sp.]